MLYICIFSNKFDLNQATRVSHKCKVEVLNKEVNCSEASLVVNMSHLYFKSFYFFILTILGFCVTLSILPGNPY